MNVPDWMNNAANIGAFFVLAGAVWRWVRGERRNLLKEAYDDLKMHVARIEAKANECDKERADIKVELAALQASHASMCEQLQGVKDDNNLLIEANAGMSHRLNQIYRYLARIGVDLPELEEDIAIHKIDNKATVIKGRAQVAQLKVDRIEAERIEVKDGDDRHPQEGQNDG